jgi:prophage regulatory protein
MHTQQQHTAASAKVLHVRDVCAITSVCRATIYRWVRTRFFPAPVQLSARRVGWREADVVQWLEARQVAPKAPWAKSAQAQPAA